MAEFDDYESLPASTPFRIIATAGAAAGVAEHCAMYPVDSIKTRMQSIACDKQHRKSMRQIFKTMVKEEGLFRPMRGMSAMVAGAGPAHAMYFGSLEMGKHLTAKYNMPSTVGDGVSAVFATCLHDAVMTPAEVVKQRMQMCCSPFCSAMDCSTTVFQTEGLRAFYRSYLTALTMNIPFQAAMVMTYGLVQRSANPEKAYKPGVHFAAGAVAGGVAAFVTMPLDVCKTLLNTQETGVLKALNKNEVKGLYNAGKTVKAMKGLRGFFQGLSPRVVYQVPSTAISWSVYEFFKYYLNKGNVEKEDCSNYETLSVMTSASAPGQIDSRVGHLRPGSSEEYHQESIQVAVPISMSRL